MERIKTRLQPDRCVMVLAALLFFYMLLLNCLTPYIADDYVYRISFYDKQPLGNLLDVCKSMYTHCFTMNGRVVSHGLEQVFMLMPKLVFNLCNGAVYTLLMYMLYRVSNFGKQGAPLLFVTVSMAFWCFLPAFGQVALWQVGSLNYLWGLAVGMAFLLPYLVCYVNRKDPLPKGWEKILFCLAALPMGMYTEVTSFVAIVLGLLLLGISIRTRRISGRTWLWAPLGIACVGFLIMMKMPAEVAAKQGEMNLAQLLRGFDTAVWMLETKLKWLCIAWGVCFGLGIYEKVQTERLVLSGLFAFGALLGNFMLTVAAYYPERCMCTSCMLLILGCGVLLPELKTGAAGALRAGVTAGVTVAFLFALARGSYDIYWSHTSFTARELAIEAAVEAGQEDLELQVVHPQSKYSAFYDLRDLDTETAETWPNKQMAAYYGVRSILGN